MSHKSKDSIEARDLKSHLHGFSDFNSMQNVGSIIMSKGDGPYVTDVNGKNYIEANSGLWNAVVGFNHKELQKVACDQFNKFPVYHSFFGRTSDTTVELAEKLIEISPVPMSKVFFTNSGSEANDSAIKMLWMINNLKGNPKKRKIITRYGAYHGVTGIATCLTARPYNDVFNMPKDDFLYTDTPHYWKFSNPEETEIQFTQRLADNLEKLIIDEDPNTIAGFIAEPVMGAGGVIIPPTDYFQSIQKILKKFNIPFIADEVICGLGRTGNLWGTTTFDMKPDIIIASKCITAGYFPIGAVLISKEIEEQLMDVAKSSEEFPHGFTNGGHPVACAVGLKAIDIITNEGVFKNMQEISPHFFEKMSSFKDHPNIGEVRCVGLMGALEMVAQKKPQELFTSQNNPGEKIAIMALKHGLICRPTGSSIILAPPFIMTHKQIDEMFDKLELTMKEVLDKI